MSFTRSRHPHSTASKTEVSVSTVQRPTEGAQLAASNRILQRLVAVCLMVVALVFFSPLMEQSGFPAFSILNGFLGASLQALAFLVVGGFGVVGGSGFCIRQTSAEDLPAFSTWVDCCGGAVELDTSCLRLLVYSAFS